MSTYLKLRNIKLVISFEHQEMARITFIRLQLRKSSCDRVQSGLVISSNGSRDIAKSLKILFGSSFVSLRAFGSKFGQFRFPVYTFQTKKPHSIIFIRSWVLVYITFACGQTFFEKVLFFSPDQEYIYISIPISTIF